MGANRGLIFAFLCFVVLHGWALYSAEAAVHYYDFILEESNFTRLCSNKSMLTVNGTFPGPVIRVQRGDTAYVNVHNQGEYGVTIHWHGVKQPRNPWYDGPENITQCPIPAGTNFTYEVIFSDEEGTLWWHAHSDWTRATVHGAIVISPPTGTDYPFPIKPDAEEVIILGAYRSWFKGDVMGIIENALATGAAPNLSDALTINGQPGDLYECSRDSTFRLLVESGKTYLLRIINAVMNEEMFFGIAGHNITVVGMDGAYLKPVSVEHIMITPGQTMDVLLTADQTPSHYYMAGSPFADSFAPFDRSTTTAIVQYTTGNYTPPPMPASPSLPAYNDRDAAENYMGLLRSLADDEHPINVPKNVTTSLYITVSVNQIDCNGTCGGPDGNSNLPGIFERDFPAEPPFYFNFTGDVGENTLYPSVGTKARLIDFNETVEIVFQGTNVANADNHPLHVHGYSFYLVGFGRGNFNNETDPINNYNLEDPPLVNTFGIPKSGWVALRFVADNPGVWFIHCHLERHSSWGMDTVLIVKNGTTGATSMRTRPNYMPPCSAP
ncbi:hypothetical protein CDL15_Pgr019178 [Punica granatum]|uniref:laccase n=1 Tax=Punica granatum TaxID=22663 RepID=A0A218W494_PUNGR|nr:hypothetical protein CDL15_Pgr019178 [Punica granatum]